jgi:hypothetical protein
MRRSMPLKIKMANKPDTHTSTSNPEAEYGNPRRIAPTTENGTYGPNKVLLDVDQAFADGNPNPPSLPQGVAGPATQANAAAYQEWADWAVLTQIMNIQNAGAEPDETALKRIAYNCGVSFSYRGGQYYNKADGGVWIPG